MRKFLITALIIFVAFFGLSTTQVSAAKILSSDEGAVTIAKTETINDDLFISAATAEIDGTVNGDVFIGAQAVRITGTINGSLHIGAQTINLEGNVKGNVYLGGQDINISGSNIGGSLLVGSQNVNVDKDTVIGGSVMVGASAIKIDSQVKRNVFAGGATLILGDNTKIGRDLYYGTGTGQTTISPKAKITGTVHKSETPAAKTPTVQKPTPTFMHAMNLGTSLISFFGALVIGLLYFKFGGKSFTKTAGFVTTSFWKSLGVGFLVIISIVPAIIILLITIIGIPVAGLAILVIAIYMILAKIVVGAALGNWISMKFKKNPSPFWAFASGLFIIYIFKLIPIVGGLVGFVVLLLGLGALTLQTFSKTE